MQERRYRIGSSRKFENSEAPKAADTGIRAGKRSSENNRWRRPPSSSATVPTTFLSESASSDRTGWTVGGGVKRMFAPHWSVFAEYNYTDFGRKDITFIAGPGTIGAPGINSKRLQMQTALAGVNDKFNFGGPVVAEY